MNSLFKNKLAHKYIFFELLPSFIMGIIVFIFILLMFQALRLTEFVLIHGVKVQTILSMIVYLSISFLPVIIPMSLLFSILLTYGRLSNDSEIIAFKSIGLDFYSISLPALLLALVATFFSAQTSFNLAPWGNRQFEVMIQKLAEKKTGASIKPGVFSEGFFDLVVYTNDIKGNTLKDVFIYDERDPNNPMTIIAREGNIFQDPNLPGHKSSLLLKNGSIHKTNDKLYTKIDFDSYNVNLFQPLSSSEAHKSVLSYELKEISEELKKSDLDDSRRQTFLIEYHRRWALAVACLFFAIAGVAFGTVTNKRNAKSGGLVICIGLIVLYWILYITFEGFAKNGHFPILLSVWAPNFIFLLLSLKPLKRAAE